MQEPHRSYRLDPVAYKRALANAGGPVNKEDGGGLGVALLKLCNTVVAANVKRSLVLHKGLVRELKVCNSVVALRRNSLNDSPKRLVERLCSLGAVCARGEEVRLDVRLVTDLPHDLLDILLDHLVADVVLGALRVWRCLVDEELSNLPIGIP